MPVIKPVFTAVASAPVASGGAVTTTVSPAVARYYSVITAGMITTDTTIPAADFLDDNDAPVAVLPAITAEQYYNVYINGMLQQSGLSTLTTASLVLATTDISVNVPVLLEVANFANTTSDITTQPTISAPTITIYT